jgi:hypothetical protein
MKTTMTSKGQVALPAKLRDQDQIVAGQQFSIERLDAGVYLLKRLPVPSGPGLTAWLLACPEKGWFQPLDLESTKSLLR